MCDISHLETIPGRAAQVCRSIVIVLANKYKGGPITRDPERQTFKHVLEFWKSQLEHNITQGEMNIVVESCNSAAMSVLAGAIARQDRDVLSLAPLLYNIIESDSSTSQTMARSMEILVQDKPFLTGETHAVIRPMYRQWAYANIVQPMYKQALPVNKAVPQAENYSIAILAILQHCPFSVYEADVEPLVRLLITCLLKMQTVGDIQAALQVLLEVLRNEPLTVRDHLKVVVTGVTRVHRLSLTKPDLASASPSSSASCRKLVLGLLAELPDRFEERFLLPFAPQLNRTLATASGDPVREVRRAALLAREKWAKVV
jgi:DNA repair/transcription protein MET18/MMS19